MNVYELSRDWWDWAFVNPDKIKPNHTAIYFFAIEHCNRLGWKKKFGLPTTMAMEATGIKSYNTYKTAIFELVSWGFINMVQRSRNQYSANIIELIRLTKIKPEISSESLDRSLVKHSHKSEKCSIKKSESTCESNSESTIQSIGESNTSIDKQYNNYTKIKEREYREFPHKSIEFEEKWDMLLGQKKWKKKGIDAIRLSLEKLSQVPEIEAIKMIDNAIVGDWQGLFPLKDYEKSKLYSGVNQSIPSPGGDPIKKSRTTKNAEVLQLVLNEIKPADGRTDDISGTD